MTSQTVVKATTFRVPTYCVLIGALLASSGCSSLPKTQNKALPAAATQTQEAQGVYEVHMKGAFAKESISRGVIDGPITVQTVLERSGAIEKFRNMEITIMRVVKESGQGIGQGLKLPVDFQSGKNAVRPEQDYAIHPNDRILIVSKSNNAIDKIVDSLAR